MRGHMRHLEPVGDSGLFRYAHREGDDYGDAGGDGEGNNSEDEWNAAEHHGDGGATDFAETCEHNPGFWHGAGSDRMTQRVSGDGP